ncbi:phospholipid transporting ATPase [Hanseniaspora valbyensis]
MVKPSDTNSPFDDEVGKKLYDISLDDEDESEFLNSSTKRENKNNTENLISNLSGQTESNKKPSALFTDTTSKNYHSAKNDISIFEEEGRDDEDYDAFSDDSFSRQVKTPKEHQHARFVDDFDDDRQYLKEKEEEKAKLKSTKNGTHDESAGVKRLRFGTRRHKDGKPKVGRAKTLKWAKSHLHNPFESSGLASHDDEAFNTNDDLSGESKNRAHEKRSLFFHAELPPSLLDEEGNPRILYPRNKIRTTKYTPISFIPKNLLFQFNNIANIYFLTMVILGAFSIFGVTNPGLASVPLIVIIIITMIKDGFEDSKRTILDAKVNNTPTYILKGIENYNVSDENISAWRKFKKACTRISVMILKFITQRLSKEGRAELLREKHKKELKQMNEQFQYENANGRNTFEYRPSMDDENRRSIHLNAVEMEKFGTLVDPTVPAIDDPSIKFKKSCWKDIKVGDIIRIHANDEIPADVILISTSDPDGACYVETKNLDGETNLKVKQSLKCSHTIRTSKDISRTRFWVDSEGPHPNLYSYQGTMKWYQRKMNANGGFNESDEDDDDEDNYIANNEFTVGLPPINGYTLRQESCNINNVLLRGCTLRNTKWAMGIVVYTGDDTKIMLNSGITPTKKSRISRELNWAVIINFIFLFVLCLVSAIANGVYYGETGTSRNYFEFGSIGGNPGKNGVISFFVAVILFQSLVPISLYISVEIIKTAQAAFIHNDVLLYYPRLDYRCTPKSWNISDDLGQIEYVFSDKTGTLTQNVMEFKKCTINGKKYGRAYTEALQGLRKREGIDVEKEAIIELDLIKKDTEEMFKLLPKLGTNSQFFKDDFTFVAKDFVNDLLNASGEYQKNCNEHFMLALALCHTVLSEPSKSVEGKLDYKAQSPDEAALVSTARDMGFTFLQRTKTGVIIEVQGVEKEFEILNILEFNSTRKRMSCIIKIPGNGTDTEPKALLICKGADSIIYSRLSKHNNDPDLLENTAKDLEDFATEGLRTLCIAQREISWSDYLKWNMKNEEAMNSLDDRDAAMENVADEIERELVLLGGTAIEDRLQDGVPDSIAILAKAGIKLWVLTGDKVETAINIGFSCNLLGNDMELLVISTEENASTDDITDPSEYVDTLIAKYLRENFDMTGSVEELQHAIKDHEVPQGEFGVVIDGAALKLVLSDPDTSRKFLLLCKNCKAVLCCRVSPAQKAAVVKLVKETLDVITLAIGDGSNDVAMIQSADVGVGIAGEEGRQAVMCSDYAIGQFRYLTRLILVHGRWSYKRLSEMIPCFFYKNVIFSVALFWYGIFNDFDGSYLFEYTYLTFYNLAFTSLPVIFLGILDQDVSDVVSLLVPELYRSGILRTEWNMNKFWIYMVDGLYQSAISFFFPYVLFSVNGIISKNALGLESRYFVGIPVTGIAVCSCNIYVLLQQYRWDWFTTMWVLISNIVFFGWTGIWSSFVKSGEFYKAGKRMFGVGAFWAVLFAGILFCLLPRFLYDVMRKMFFPRDIDIIRECWKKGEYDQYPMGYDPTDPNRKKIVKFMPDLDNINENDLDHESGVDLFEQTNRRLDTSSHDTSNRVTSTTNTIKSHFRHLSESVPIINGRQSSVISSPIADTGEFNFNNSRSKESVATETIQLDDLDASIRKRL